jgi:hypothetical protein
MDIVDESVICRRRVLFAYIGSAFIVTTVGKKTMLRQRKHLIDALLVITGTHLVGAINVPFVVQS